MNEKTVKEPLTLNGLLAKLKTAGLVPVRVVDGFEIGGKKLKHPVLSFDGTLPEFIDTAVALNTKAIFVSVAGFDEEEFFYEVEQPETPSTPDNQTTSTRFQIVQIITPGAPITYRREPIRERRFEDEDGRIPGPKRIVTIPPEPDVLDLAMREPRLKSYRERVGQPFEYVVSFFCSGAVLRLQVREPWYAQFETIRQEITKVLDEEADARILQERNKLAEEYKKQEAERAGLLASLKQALLDDESIGSRHNLYYNSEALIRSKYPEEAAKLGSHLGLLVQEIQEESQKMRNEESRQRMEERMQEERDEESFNKERQTKLAALKKALPSDADLMALPSKIAMRTYLLDKHPELFETLVPSKRTQEDLINWLFLQKQKKRS